MSQSNFAIQIVIGARDTASAALDRVRRSLRLLKTAATGAGGALRLFSAPAAVAVGAGVYAFQRALRGGISSAADFEAQMSAVEAVSGATASEMEALTAEAERLGASTPFTATEAAQGLEELSRAGFTAKESIGALESTLTLAQADGMELGRASEIVSDAIRGMGLEATDTAQVADVFAQASQNANTNVERLGSALSYVGPEAAAAGMSLQETVSAVSAMQDAGIQGERAGTMLRSILSQLADPATEASRALEDMGIDTSSLTSAVRGLNDAGPEASSAINSFTMESRAGLRVLMQKGGDDLEAFTEMLNNSQGAAQDAAETMQDNMQGAVTRLGSAWDALRRKLVDPLIEPITENINRFTAALGDFADSRGVTYLRDAFLRHFERAARAVRNFLGQFSNAEIGQILAQWVDVAAGAIRSIWKGFVWLWEQIGSFYGWITSGDRLENLVQMFRGVWELIKANAWPVFKALVGAINVVARGFMRIVNLGKMLYHHTVSAVEGMKRAFYGFGAAVMTVVSWVAKLLDILAMLGGWLFGLGSSGFGLTEMANNARDDLAIAAGRANTKKQQAEANAFLALADFLESPDVFKVPDDPPWKIDEAEKARQEAKEQEARDLDASRDAASEGIKEGIKEAKPWEVAEPEPEPEPEPEQKEEEEEPKEEEKEQKEEEEKEPEPATRPEPRPEPEPEPRPEPEPEPRPEPEPASRPAPRPEPKELRANKVTLFDPNGEIDPREHFRKMRERIIGPTEEASTPQGGGEGGETGEPEAPETDDPLQLLREIRDELAGDREEESAAALESGEVVSLLRAIKDEIAGMRRDEQPQAESRITIEGEWAQEGGETERFLQELDRASRRSAGEFGYADH